jgi:hypothetical protein
LANREGVRIQVDVGPVQSAPLAPAQSAVGDELEKPYRRSPAARSRNRPVCSGVRTITGEGRCPVARQRRTRSSVHTSGLGALAEAQAGSVRERMIAAALASRRALRRSVR